MITSIRKLKICGDSICVLLEMNFKQALLTSSFSSKWKKEMLLPLTKRETRKHKLPPNLIVSDFW